MTLQNLTLLLIIGSISILFLIVFIPIIISSRHKTMEIVKKTYPQFIELNKTIVSVTSGIIAITVSFIDKSQSNEFLIFSWVLLGICIIMSVIILLLQYVSEYLFEVFSKLLCDFSKAHIDEDMIIENDKTKLKSSKYLFNQYIIIENSKYICLYIQLVSFASGLVLLLAFGII